MKNINLSIIIPYRNTVDLLKNLLDSIGVFSDIQVIVIDDSSDQNLEKFEQLKQNKQYKNILFLKNDDQKRSAGKCRNIGLNNAHGKWIMFADSDDFFVESYYEKLNKYFNSAYDAVFFTPTSLDLDTGKISDRHVFFQTGINNYLAQPNQKNELVIRYKLYTPWSKLIRRTLIEDNHIRFHEVFVKNDSYFSLNVGYYMKYFTVSKETVYCATWHSQGNISKRKDDLFVTDSTISRIKIYNFLKEKLNKQEQQIVDVESIPANHIISLIDTKIDKRLIKRSINIFKENSINPLSLKNKLAILKRKFNLS